MAVRFSSPVVRRGQVPLTQEDLEALQEVVSQPTAREFLAGNDLLPATGDVSESVVLHALVEVGMKAVRQARDAAGYALLAADPEYQKYLSNARSRRALRRRPRHADDA
jgi:hypothetical protein